MVVVCGQWLSINAVPYLALACRRHNQTCSLSETSNLLREPRRVARRDAPPPVGQPRIALSRARAARAVRLDIAEEKEFHKGKERRPPKRRTTEKNEVDTKRSPIFYIVKVIAKSWPGEGEGREEREEAARCQERNSLLAK